MTGHVRVLDARIAAVTDLGRARGPQFGMPVNGALDQYSARVANTLCANREDEPLIEVTAFDFVFSCDVDVLIAVTGAPMQVYVDDIAVPMWEPVPVPAGQRVTLTGMTEGMRSYVAVQGSFEVPRLLESCAPDTVIGFGTTLSASSKVALAAPAGIPINPYLGCSLFNLETYRPHFGDGAVIDVVDGPDIEDFGASARRLFDGRYAVLPNSNHIGLRLSGGPLPERVSSEELISRGVPIGAVEVPPGDQLLILHRGRGVTAGYPVLGVVSAASLDTLGQVRPGQSVTFRRIDVATAAQDSRFWRETIDGLRERITTVFTCLGLEKQLAPPTSSQPTTQ